MSESNSFRSLIRRAIARKMSAPSAGADAIDGGDRGAAKPAMPLSDETPASIVGEIADLAAFPEITARLLKVLDDPQCSTEQVAGLVLRDPGISGAVLKFANSAYFGCSRHIGSIALAVPMLGLNAIRNIALALSVSKIYPSGPICPGFAAWDLWRHSIGVAVAAQMLAEQSRRIAVEEAFLAGLMHDVGILVSIQARRDRFIKTMALYQANDEMTFREAEQRVLGHTHEALGAALCDVWNFPSPLIAAVSLHHRPSEADAESQDIVRIINLAETLAKRCNLGFCDADSDEVDDAALSQLSLSETQLQTVADSLPEHTSEMIGVLPRAA